MNTCPKCGGEMKMLLVSSYCAAECDRAKPEPAAPVALGKPRIISEMKIARPDGWHYPGFTPETASGARIHQLPTSYYIDEAAPWDPDTLCRKREEIGNTSAYLKRILTALGSATVHEMRWQGYAGAFHYCPPPRPLRDLLCQVLCSPLNYMVANGAHTNRWTIRFKNIASEPNAYIIPESVQWDES